MTAAELAALLNGREIRCETTRSEREAAAAAGLVIIYGASDDLIELEGAIEDEVGAYEGGTFGFSRHADSIELVHLDDGACYYGPKIEAVWLPDEDLSWAIRTNLPHSQFVIFEDGEPFCRGAVVARSDILQAIHQAFPG